MDAREQTIRKEYERNLPKESYGRRVMIDKFTTGSIDFVHLTYWSNGEERVAHLPEPRLDRNFHDLGDRKLVAAAYQASTGRSDVKVELNRPEEVDYQAVSDRTHQSARYSLRWAGLSERHSSSGVIVSTGTGATGWARSISRERSSPFTLPAPEPLGYRCSSKRVALQVGAQVLVMAAMMARCSSINSSSDTQVLLGRYTLSR